MKNILKINENNIKLDEIDLKVVATKPKANTNLLIEKLMKFKNVYHIATSLGPSHNVLVHFRGKNREYLYEFVEWLKKQDEVQELDVNMIYDVLKSGYHTIPVDQLF